MIFIPEQPVISQYFVTLKHPSHAQKLKKKLSSSQALKPFYSSQNPLKLKTRFVWIEQKDSLFSFYSFIMILISILLQILGLIVIQYDF